MSLLLSYPLKRSPLHEYLLQMEEMISFDREIGVVGAINCDVIGNLSTCELCTYVVESLYSSVSRICKAEEKVWRK